MDSPTMRKAALAESVLSVERLSFRTGEFHGGPTRSTDPEAVFTDLPGSDEPAPLATYYIDDVTADSKGSAMSENETGLAESVRTRLEAERFRDRLDHHDPAISNRRRWLRLVGFHFPVGGDGAFAGFTLDDAAEHRAGGAWAARDGVRARAGSGVMDGQAGARSRCVGRDLFRSFRARTWRRKRRRRAGIRRSEGAAPAPVSLRPPGLTQATISTTATRPTAMFSPSP